MNNKCLEKFRQFVKDDKAQIEFYNQETFANFLMLVISELMEKIQKLEDIK